MNTIKNNLNKLTRRFPLWSQWNRYQIDKKIIAIELENFHRQQKKKGYDSFGFDPDIMDKFIPLISFLYYFYHRVEIHHKKYIPKSQAIYVANHSGQIPIDALMIIFSRAIEKRPSVLLRTMMDYCVPQIPFIGSIFMGLGGVLGTPENFRALISQGKSILIFPEGVRGISKNFCDRYQLVPFTKGFMRLAMETKIQIVPVALIGAEEQYLKFGNLSLLASFFKFPVFPISPTFPLLGLWGAIPAPTKYHIFYGQPRTFSFTRTKEPEKEIESNVKKIENQVKKLLQKGLRQRKGIFF